MYRNYQNRRHHVRIDRFCMQEHSCLRYFFDVQLGHGLFPDKEGTELADISAAEAEANAILAELPRVRAGEACSATVTVRDESFHSVLEGRLTVEVTKL